MAVRASMAELIARVRTLIGDPAGANQAFDDQTIQDALDRYQTVVHYAELQAMPTYSPGRTEYLDFYAAVGDWESDAALYDSGWEEVAPASSDYLTGHWSFTEEPALPVFIVGKTYDVYAAAADLLEAWAAKEKLSFDFDADGASFRRSQKVKALLELAAEYRRKQRPMLSLQVRGDVTT